MLLVKNAKVYAPEYLGVKDILLAGGKIEKIADHLPEYEGCEVIDGTGKIVTPGIIDRHVHVTGGGGEEVSTRRHRKFSSPISSKAA